MTRAEALAELELRPDAQIDAENVRKAFRSKAKRVHPDVNPAADAHEQFLHLQEAVRTLSGTLSPARDGQNAWSSMDDLIRQWSRMGMNEFYAREEWYDRCYEEGVKRGQRAHEVQEPKQNTIKEGKWTRGV